MAILEAIEVSKTFQQGSAPITAVDRASLTVEPGEVLVIEGPSGSGKSTLLQLLGALDRPTDGRVLLDGQDLGRLSDDQLAELRARRLGFVFQAFHLIPTLTAAENVQVATVPTGLPCDPQALLERVGLGHRASHLPGKLSGGEQQRVAIARALANDPAVILADEPTGNLDQQSGELVMDLLVRLGHEQGRAVVVVTHSPYVRARADRVLQMRDGRIGAVGGMARATP